MKSTGMIGFAFSSLALALPFFVGKAPDAFVGSPEDDGPTFTLLEGLSTGDAARFKPADEARAAPSTGPG